MGYPAMHVALSAEDAERLRGLHAAGDDAAVLARARELAADEGRQMVFTAGQ
jgi:hypothetical protein